MTNLTQQQKLEKKSKYTPRCSHCGQPISVLGVHVCSSYQLYKIDYIFNTIKEEL